MCYSDYLQSAHAHTVARQRRNNTASHLCLWQNRFWHHIKHGSAFCRQRGAKRSFACRNLLKFNHGGYWFAQHEFLRIWPFRNSVYRRRNYVHCACFGRIVGTCTLSFPKHQKSASSRAKQIWTNRNKRCIYRHFACIRRIRSWRYRLLLDLQQSVYNGSTINFEHCNESEKIYWLWCSWKKQKGTWKTFFGWRNKLS